MVKKGAIVVGEKPVDTPSYSDNQDEFNNRLVEEHEEPREDHGALVALLDARRGPRVLVCDAEHPGSPDRSAPGTGVRLPRVPRRSRRCRRPRFPQASRYREGASARPS